MPHLMRTTALGLALSLAAGPAAIAQQETGPNGYPIVGGAEMTPDKTIVGNAVNSADHTTLVAAVQAAGLTDTLNGDGPFTVFAPVNAAFEALPDGTVDTLLMEENRDQLVTVLTCHVVAADVMSDALAGMISDDGGTHPVETMGGCMLDAEMADGTITLTDARGNTATVTNPDVEQLNGVIHVIDTVMLPAEEGSDTDMSSSSGAEMASSDDEMSNSEETAESATDSAEGADTGADAETMAGDSDTSQSGEIAESATDTDEGADGETIAEDSDMSQSEEIAESATDTDEGADTGADGETMADDSEMSQSEEIAESATDTDEGADTGADGETMTEDSGMSEGSGTDTAENNTDNAGGDNPIVGGAAMLPSRDIIDNAVNSADHTTLVAAVQQAKLVETLKGDGPFTVFAPTNAAFDALPGGTVESLMMDENRDQLTKVLTAHVVPGALTASDIVENRGSDGFYHMQTVSGDALSAQVADSGNVYIFDESGNAYQVVTADVMQSNGVIHVVDGVLLPR